MTINEFKTTYFKAYTNWISDCVDKSGKIDVKDFLKMTNEEVLKKNDGRRYDVCLMNPPYQVGLHMKFLNKVVDICNNVVTIQPNVYDNLTEKSKISEKIKPHIKDLEVIDNITASRTFGIGTASNLAIITCVAEEVNNYKYKYEKAIPILEKLKKVRNWRNNLKYTEHEFEFHCQGDNGYYKGSGLTAKGLLKGKCNARLVFNSQEEKDNFYNSLDCWPYKFMFIIDNGSAIPAHLPYMVDYTKPWTDGRFYKFFDITDDEKEIIKEIIKDYDK